VPVVVFAELERDGQRVAFRCPYDADFIASFKARVPAHRREWDNSVKAWAVHRDLWLPTRALLRQYYGDDAIQNGPAIEAVEIELLESEVDVADFEDYATLGVRSDAPACVIHAAVHAIVFSHTRIQQELDAGEL